MENVEEIAHIIFIYIFIYGMAISFMLIGIVLIITPTNQNTPNFVPISFGLGFFMMGIIFLFMAIKFSLGRYIDTRC